MIIVPRKWLPYFFIVLGVFGTIVMVRSAAPDKVSGTIVCALAAVGGVIWAIIDFRRNKRDKQ